METFIERGETLNGVMAMVREKYGDQARVMTYRKVRIPRFLGLFPADGIEVQGHIAQPRQSAFPGNEHAAARPSPRKDPEISALLAEVRQLKDQVASLPDRTTGMKQHPALDQLAGLLRENDFPEAYVQRMLARCRSELSLSIMDDRTALESRVRQWISESITIHPPQKKPRPHVMMLIGPTGVGKTTTIAKLAARFGFDSDGRMVRRIRMITIDNYRIGAPEQMKIYGEIMNIPVAVIKESDELRQQLALASDTDLVLVDTIGRSPRDFEQLGRMQTMLSSTGVDAETHLAISATTKSWDIREVIRQFEPFAPKSVLVTKLDETTRIGNVIGALDGYDRGISWITTGQRVPQDIERAERDRLMTWLSGFPPPRNGETAPAIASAQGAAAPGARQ